MIQLNIINDQLFVLTEKNDKENLKDPSKTKEDAEANGGKLTQNQGKKAQYENLKQMGKFNQKLDDLLYSTKELEENAQRTGSLLENDLHLKVKCGLESF